jgi:hypothetical protein
MESVCLSLVERALYLIAATSPSSQLAVVVVLPLVVVIIVPLVPRFGTGPNVCPASVDTLSTDSFMCGCV